MGARRGLAIGVVVVVLGIGGAVVADRVAVGAARDIAVRELRSNLDDVAGEPEVAIDGFPFLTQLLAGTLTGVSARVDGLTFDGVEVTDVDVDAEGVTTSEPYTVDRAVLTGTLSVATLQALIASSTDLDLVLSLDGDQLIASLEVLGLPLDANLVPRAEDGGIRVDVVSVGLGGAQVDVSALPGAVADQLSGLAVPVGGLPDGVALTRVSVRDGGVRITATGTDVVVPVTAAG